MNPKSLVALGAVTVIALTLAILLVNGSRDADRVSDEQALLPGLKEQVNDIEAIDIVVAGGETAVALRRERERWRVRQKSDYEADFAQIHDLLRDLAEARRLEERTSSPEWYPRIGVADIDSQQADGVLLAFPDTDVPELIVGHADSAGIGHYVRVAGEARSWLTDRRLEVPVTPMEWVERAIMDIPAGEMAEVTLRHPDGQTVRLRPAGEAGDTWVLLEVPEGREPVQPWQLRQTANALATLNLEDVRPHEGTVPEDVVRALYRTRDGLNFLASLFEVDGDYRVHFSVSAEVAATEGETQAEDDTELRIDAAAVDARLSPWQFSIPQSRFDNMTPRLEDLLAAEE